VSRTFELGLEPVGGKADLLYDLSRPSVLVTLSGPAPTIDALDPATLHATITVGTLEVGTHLVTVGLVAPPDITVSINPTSVDVTVRVVPRPSPSASESPSGSPLAPTPVP